MNSIYSRVLLAATLTLGATGAAFPQVLSIGSESVTTGGIATVNLDISGLGNGTALGVFDVNVGFNPGVVSFASATYGDPVLGDQLNLEGFGTVTNTTPGSGAVDLFELSFDSPSVLTASQPPGFTLATLTFDTVSTGISPLGLSLNAVGDAYGNSLSPSLLNGSISVEPRSISAVPEGGSMAYLLSGLAVFLGRRMVLRDRRLSRTP